MLTVPRLTSARGGLFGANVAVLSAMPLGRGNLDCPAFTGGAFLRWGCTVAPIKTAPTTTPRSRPCGSRVTPRNEPDPHASAFSASISSSHFLRASTADGGTSRRPVSPADSFRIKAPVAAGRNSASEAYPESYWAQRIASATVTLTGARAEARRMSRQLMRKDPDPTVSQARRAWPFSGGSCPASETGSRSQACPKHKARVDSKFGFHGSPCPPLARGRPECMSASLPRRSQEAPGNTRTTRNRKFTRAPGASESSSAMRWSASTSIKSPW